MNGLTTVNVELTSRCNKNCWMCGRRKIEREYPGTRWGDMDYELVKSIANQLPRGIVIQFHDNGEPLLYPALGQALSLFNNQIRCMDTNGKLLLEKADEIIDNLDTITISTFEGDPEADEQYEIIKEFLALKGDRKPNVIVRCLGNVDLDKYSKLGVIIATRVLHSPFGSFDYKKPPTIPEIGICLDFLNHMVIKCDGRVAYCVRFDPNKGGLIGNASITSLEDIWNSELRKMYLEYHIKGERDKMPLCASCAFWGVPVS